MNLWRTSLTPLALFTSACQIRERPVELFPETPAAGSALVSGSPVQGELTAVGAASADFIPRKPVALSGFGGLGRRFFPPLVLPGGDLAFCKPYERIENPPRIKAAIFELKSEDGKLSQQFLISLDVVAVTSDLTQKIHQLISSISGGLQTNLANTVVLATHTHSGPAGLTENPLWSTFVCDQFNPELTEDYLETLRSVLLNARSKLTKLKHIETSTTELPALLKSRMENMRSNPEISLVSFRSETGSIPLSLVQLAAHPTYWGTRDLVLSADLVSPVESALRSRVGAEEVILTQTEIGNMDANLAAQSPSGWAEELANAVIEKEKSTDTNSAFAASSGALALPSAKINWDACGATAAQGVVSLPILDKLPRRMPYSLWKINGSVYVFLSGEWTTAAAESARISIRDLFPVGTPIKIFSLANDYTGYHLPRTDFATPSIESCSSVYGGGAVEQLTSALRLAAENFSFSAWRER